MMKINKNIVRGILSVAALGLLSGCSNDYLTLDPETSQSTSTVTGNADVAQQAIYGICKAMLSQYTNANWNNNNGECYINNLFNDGLGQDYHNGLAENAFTGTYLDFNNNNLTSPSLIINAYPWKYAYNIISQANNILDGIDNASGESARRDFVKAQALTFRAFGYCKLLMLYAPRWEDSKNGEALCLPLRLLPGTDQMPLSSMKTVLDQCYADLDEAITLYQECGIERENKWEPNLDVAYGVYTRLALVKNDWPVAQDMAHKARASYPVMDNNTLFAGFYIDNSDFMWVSSDDETDAYYFSNGSNYSCNGGYVENWGVGAGAIDLILYRMLDENDVRREWFYTPDKVLKYKGNVKKNPGGLTPADYWNSELVDPGNLCSTSIGPTSKPKFGKWGMCHVGVHFAEDYINETYTGNKGDIVSEGFYAYYSLKNKQESGYFLWGKGEYVKLVTMPIGAQFKFFSKAPYGAMSFPFMRGTEMCLAEAEAAYHNGDFTTAQNCLNEINGKRIPGYTCSSTGDALFDEITLCRRIELWGEGQNFTDFKRWNMPIIRLAWEEGNENSGNWQPDCGCEIPSTAIHGFRLNIPQSETYYNHLINMSDLYK